MVQRLHRKAPLNDQTATAPQCAFKISQQYRTACPSNQTTKPSRRDEYLMIHLLGLDGKLWKISYNLNFQNFIKFCNTPLPHRGSLWKLWTATAPRKSVKTLPRYRTVLAVRCEVFTVPRNGDIPLPCHQRKVSNSISSLSRNWKTALRIGNGERVIDEGSLAAFSSDRQVGEIWRAQLVTSC